MIKNVILLSSKTKGTIDIHNNLVGPQGCMLSEKNFQKDTYVVSPLHNILDKTVEKGHRLKVARG